MSYPCGVCGEEVGVAKRVFVGKGSEVYHRQCLACSSCGVKGKIEVPRCDEALCKTCAKRKPKRSSPPAYSTAESSLAKKELEVTSQQTEKLKDKGDVKSSTESKLTTQPSTEDSKRNEKEPDTVKPQEIEEWLASKGLPANFLGVLLSQGITSVKQLQDSSVIRKLPPQIGQQILAAQANKQSQKPQVDLQSPNLKGQDSNLESFSSYLYNDNIRGTSALVFMGDTGAGKSTLCNSFVRDSPFNVSHRALATTIQCKGVFIPELGFTIMDVPGFGEVQSNGGSGKSRGRSNLDLIQLLLQYIADNDLKILGFIICVPPHLTPRLPKSISDLFLTMCDNFEAKFCLASRIIFTQLNGVSQSKCAENMVMLFQKATTEGAWNAHPVQFPGTLNAPFDEEKRRYQTKDLETFAQLQRGNNFSFSVDWQERRCLACSQYVKSRVQSKCHIHVGSAYGCHSGPFQKRHPKTKKFHPGTQTSISGLENTFKSVGSFFSFGKWIPKNYYMSCCGIDTTDATSETSGCVEQCVECEVRWPVLQVTSAKLCENKQKPIHSLVVTVKALVCLGTNYKLECSGTGITAQDPVVNSDGCTVNFFLPDDCPWPPQELEITFKLLPPQSMDQPVVHKLKDFKKVSNSEAEATSQSTDQPIVHKLKDFIKVSNFVMFEASEMPLVLTGCRKYCDRCKKESPPAPPCAVCQICHTVDSEKPCRSDKKHVWQDLDHEKCRSCRKDLSTTGCIELEHIFE